MSKLTVVKYSPDHKRSWDDFIKSSKNGVFLFARDYIEYHSDRFPDHSLMLFDETARLVALLPATLRNDILSSHDGLTFGGFISDSTMKVGLMLEVFTTTIDYLRQNGFAKFIYKAVPHIYHQQPAEEDLYALFRAGAGLYRRDVSVAIDMRARLPFNKGRRWSIKQAEKNGLRVSRSDDFKSFMAIEEHLLENKYDARPVHTTSEIEMLAGHFPDNIKLFAAHHHAEMVAGVIIYESSQVAHAQYIGANDQGKKSGAVDLIMSYLINDYYATKEYFDFGISTEDGGRTLNTGLVQNKQGYGARAVVYDFYELPLNNETN